MGTYELCVKANAKMNRTFDKLRRALRQDVVRPNAIVWVQKTTNAGESIVVGDPRKPFVVQIKINMILLERHPVEIINQVVPHEVCHSYAEQLFGTELEHVRHGKEWRRLMTILRLPPTVSHEFDTTGLGRPQPRPHVYMCACQEHCVTKRKHQNIQKDIDDYFCTDCKKQIRYISI